MLTLLMVLGVILVLAIAAGVLFWCALISPFLLLVAGLVLIDVLVFGIIKAIKRAKNRKITCVCGKK